MATQEQFKGIDPAQKKAMELMVRQGMSFLLQDDNANHIVMKAKAGDPKAAVLEAVTPLLEQIYQMASVAGAKVDMVTVLAAGIQIIAGLAKMLEAADILTEDQIPAFCADVAKEAVNKHNVKVYQAGQKKPPGMMGAKPPMQPAPPPGGAQPQPGV